MGSWEAIKQKRTPLTWGGVILVITILWSTNLLQLIWIQGVNASLMSDVEGAAMKLEITVAAQRFEASITQKFDNDMIARAKREINKIDEAIRYDKTLSEDEKEFKRGRKAELKELIKCIKEGKDNCV